MLIKDLITDTPKVLLLFRCYLFRFSFFRLLIRRGRPSRRLEFLTVFFAWSLAIFAVSNLLIEGITGKKILELSGQLERILVVHNGEVIDFSGQRWPVVIQILGNELGWSFDVGFKQMSIFAAPLDPDTLGGGPCILVDQSTEQTSAEEMRAKFEAYRAKFTEDCLTDHRGYLVLVQRPQMVFSESNMIEYSSRFAFPPFRSESLESIVAIPDRTCFGNGAYAACFEFLDATGLSATAGFMILLIFALTYAACCAVVDRLWFKAEFIDSILSFFALNMTCIVLAGVILLGTTAGELLLQLDATGAGLGSIIALLAFHLLRIAMLFSHAMSQPWWKRALALGGGLALSWTIGAVLFLPLQIGLILFHDVVSRMV